MMSSAMVPLRTMPEFVSLITKFENPFIGVLVGALFTAAFVMRWDNKTPYAGVGDVSVPIYVTLSL